MNASIKQSLMAKIRTLSLARVSALQEFVEFLVSKSRRLEAFDRLLAIAPALTTAGAPPLSVDEIAAEVREARAERRARQTGLELELEDDGAGRS